MPLSMATKNILFNWIWLRRIIDRHFDKLLLVILIGLSIMLACIGDIAVMRGKEGFNLVSREWLREQTALLVGALLGLMRGGRGEYSDLEPRDDDTTGAAAAPMTKTPSPANSSDAPAGAQ